MSIHERHRKFKKINFAYCKENIALHDDFYHQFSNRARNASLNRKNGFEIFLRACWEENIPLKFRL